MATNGVGVDVDRSKMRDFDINQPAWALEGEEEEEIPTGSAEDGDVVEVEEGNNNRQRKKKLCLSKEQCGLLEESFVQNYNPNHKQKEELAAKLKLRPRQVEVWFQNRRARTKLKKTEIDHEYLKSYFGSLTEENIKLKKEVEELRALRVAPPTVLSPETRLPMPASSLTMCPRCQQITTIGNSVGALQRKSSYFL